MWFFIQHLAVVEFHFFWKGPEISLCCSSEVVLGSRLVCVYVSVADWSGADVEKKMAHSFFPCCVWGCVLCALFCV